MLYSFDLDHEGAVDSYNRMFAAYLRTFSRLGLRAIPMRADTGPIGGDLSHEFIILADTGESEVFCHKHFLDFDIPADDTDFWDAAAMKAIFDKWTSLYAATSEMHDEAAFNAIDDSRRYRPAASKLATSSTSAPSIPKPWALRFRARTARNTRCTWAPTVSARPGWFPPSSKLSHDENGIIWPASIAPFDAVVINMKSGDEACDAACETIYAALNKAGF